MPLSIICAGIGAAWTVWQHAQAYFAANVTQYEEPRRHAVQLLAARAPKPTHRRAASASAAHAHTRSTTPAAAHYGPAPTRCPSTPTPDTPPPVPGSAPSAVDPCSPRFVRRHHGCKVLSFGGRAKDGLPERLRLRSKPTPGVAANAGHCGRLDVPRSRSSVLRISGLRPYVALYREFLACQRMVRVRVPCGPTRARHLISFLCAKVTAAWLSGLAERLHPNPANWNCRAIAVVSQEGERVSGRSGLVKHLRCRVHVGEHFQGLAMRHHRKFKQDHAVDSCEWML